MYPNYYTQPQSYAPRYTGQVLRVNGRNGAEAFQMQANCSALLLDETQPIVWLAQTDAAGYKSLTAFDTKPHEEKPDTTMAYMEQRIKRLEDMMHDKSCTCGDARRRSQPKPDTTGESNSEQQ